MPAKPALVLSAAAFSAAALALLGFATLPVSAAPAKAPLPTVLLYPATPGDVAALVDLRTRLRLDSRVQVLTYDPESAAIQRVSAETTHPEWLVSAPATDAGRMVLARALGASFYAVVSPGRAADTTHVELVETAPAARTFDWTGTNREFGVHALESQVADSLAHPVSYANVADNSPAGNLPAATGPLSAAPVAELPTRETPPLTPMPTTALPVPVAALPVPVAASPVPVAVPLDLPTQTTLMPSVAPDSRPIRIILPKLPLTTPQITQVPLPVAPTRVSQVPLPLAAPLSVSAPAQAMTRPKSVPPKIAALPADADTRLPQTVNGPTLNTLPAQEIITTPKVASVPKLTAAPVPSIAPPVETFVPKPPVQIAALPPRVIPAPPLAQPEPLLPPTPVIVVKKRTPNAEDMTAILPLMAKGDAALDGGDTVSAIALYRQAVNGSPLSVVPRLKLAQAYQKDGLSDRALDEARRALEIAPDSVPVQQFLSDLDQQTGTSVGALTRDRAALASSPNDPLAHAALADALWNSGDLGGAEAEYKAASALSPRGSHLAEAQLAQLYAAEARYTDCLAVLKGSGPGGYALAIGIVVNRADTLSSTLSASRTAFAGGKSTREQFYDDAKKLSAEAQALAEFVAVVSPPAQYKLPHLHRMLSTNLLAQESAALVTFIETGDTRQSDSIAQLEHAAATEMLTAQAAEERLGLWKQHTEKQSEK